MNKYKDSERYAIYWGISIITLIISLIVYAGWPRYSVMKVTATQWDRVIDIQVLKTIHYNDEEYVPDNARISDSHSRNKCTTTYHTNSRTGHRYTTESCRWVTYYDYDVEEFVHARYAKASGMYGSVPRWPDYTLNLSPTGPFGVGVERVGSQTADYTIFASNTERGNCSLKITDEARWNLYSPSQVVTGKFNFGSLSDLILLEQ